MPNQTTICVPDIGDFDSVEVIEILVKAGDSVEKEDSLITLESDKASMEIPAPQSGVIKKILINLGDKIKQGDDIATIEPSIDEATDEKTQTTQTNASDTDTSETKKETATNTKPENPVTTPNTVVETTAPAKQNIQAPNDALPSELPPHASPNIRKLARELGVDLSQVMGSGEKNRILDSDLKKHVKQIINQGGGIPSIAKIDFSQFGAIEETAQSRIKKIASKHLSACWLNVPHVTQFDDVDISELEEFRRSQKAKGVKLTPLVFIMKALVQALKRHPAFNASLDGDILILKKYYHFGIAVNTDAGLVVPVVRDVDKKNLQELASELTELSARARAGKLSKKDLTGGSMTISSLGGIGGSHFTPIVNAPEVAILGVGRSQIKPIWHKDKFIPAPILPLALSYDHRAIDGAQGAEFITTLNQLLTDIREILL